MFSFVFKKNNLVISLNFNNIIVFKEEKDINSSYDNWHFDIKKVIENNQKNKY